MTEECYEKHAEDKKVKTRSEIEKIINTESNTRSKPDDKKIYNDLKEELIDKH